MAAASTTPDPLLQTVDPMITHFDRVARGDARARRFQRGFHAQLLAWYRHHIPANRRVLECGCGTGSLLARLNPSRGLGLDFSKEMVARAQSENRIDGCEYRVADATEPVTEIFDHIVLDYLIGYLSDIQRTLEAVRLAAHARTRLHITTLNTPWHFVLRWAEWFGVVMKQPPSNWLSHEDIFNLLHLTGWEVVTFERIQLWPCETPLLAGFFNRFLVRLPFFRHFGITLAITARPRMKPELTGGIGCSVVIPARNEAGNIAAALSRIPVLGRGTEIIFVEGGSTDDTWARIERYTAAYRGPHQVRAIRQTGRGKWNAVREGLALARGDVLVIQDADLTAPPEDLPKFHDAISSGAAEFANGSRLVYPTEARAMRFLNFLGNKFFALALTSILGQPVKDSLCGTKMLLRSDYERLLARIQPFGDFDPFGDFNLLFGASLLDLRIRDIPVRYRDRTYGRTNISRFSHGWMLLKMTWFGMRKLRPGKPR